MLSQVRAGAWECGRSSPYKGQPDLATLCKLQAAAAAAVAALGAMQRPCGEIPTYEARSPSMAAAKPYRSSVYTTSFAIHALQRVAGLSGAAAIMAAAGEHLHAERNPDGSWSYEGRATRRVPPDLDDSACAAAALALLGVAPDLRLFRLLWENEAAPGGPYYTWVGVNQGTHLLARQLDALVNANLLFCAAMARIELPGAAAYLCDLITRPDLTPASDYCLSPHLLVYALARAALDGPAPSLSPVLPALATHARRLTTATPFELACATATLLALGEQKYAAPLLEALLVAQQPDGAWPIALAYTGYPPNFAGAPGLTTAIALDAIGRALVLERC
jgi:hypothetical protein